MSRVKQSVVFIMSLLFVGVCLARGPVNSAHKTKTNQRHSVRRRKNKRVKKQKHVRKTSLKHKGQKLNLNTATPRELAKAVKGVGLKTATAIVKFRQQHGPIKSWDEIAPVKINGRRLRRQVVANLKQQVELR